LSAYYDEYKDEFKDPVFIEKFLGYGWSKVYIDDVRIGGRVDKVEWIDKTKKTVMVVDYKTGQPKSRNEIEGNTANSNGDYKRQLLFYKLLADLDRTFTVHVEKGMFDFIQPEKSGKFVQHEFLLEKEEVDGLRQLIKDTMKEIRALQFLRTTDTSICHRCEFKDHCWPEGVPEK